MSTKKADSEKQYQACEGDEMIMSITNKSGAVVLRAVENPFWGTEQSPLDPVQHGCEDGMQDWWRTSITRRLRSWGVCKDEDERINCLFPPGRRAALTHAGGAQSGAATRLHYEEPAETIGASAQDATWRSTWGGVLEEPDLARHACQDYISRLS